MTKTQSKSLRMNLTEAAALLGVSTTKVWRLSKQDVFTVIHPNGTGIGKRCYYLRDEIELYALTGSRELVMAHRRKNKRS